MFYDIDANGYFICDAPHAKGVSANIVDVPPLNPDGTGMRKPRFVSGAWIDEEASLLAADLAAKSADIRRNEIIKRLQEIDIDSVRALRAQKLGRGSQPDIDKLTALEDEAVILRTELGGL